MVKDSSSMSSSPTPSEPTTQAKTWTEGYTRDSYSSSPSLPPSSAAITGQKPSIPPNARQKEEASISNAWNSIKPSDFLSVHQTPCARQGFLTGIGGGAAVGVLRYVMGAPVPKAANWAVGIGVLASLGQYEFCQYQRRLERVKMQRVVEVYTKAQTEARQKEAEERRRKAAEEAEAEAARERKKSWYRFW
jgi:cytochrome c oxidase assembly protein subunit 20